MKILHFTEQGQVVTLNAREVALSILKKGALFKGDLAQIGKTVVISALISAMYLSLPYFYGKFGRRAASTADAEEYASSVSLSGLSSILSCAFRFVMASLLLTELGTSLLNLFERLILLKVFTDITSRSRSTKRKLPYIKLYTPENIVCWQSIREYVLAHHQARLVWFQVLTAFGAAYIAFVSLTLALRFWNKDAFGLADIQGFFVVLVGGIYALIVIFIGAMVDSAQKSHVKVLLKQKWKLQRHLLRYEETQTYPSKKLTFEQGSTVNPREMIDKMMYGEDDDDMFDGDSSLEFDSEDDDSGKDQKRNAKSKSTINSRKSSFQSPSPSKGTSRPSAPTGHHQHSPLSPISLTTPLKGREQEIAEECQKLLSRLIKVLERTDQPLRLLGVLKVDMALAIKVGGILASVLISRMKSLFSK